MKPHSGPIQRSLSDVSPMPTGLVNVLTAEQISDLLVFLEVAPF
jgi:hypothetical protein